MLVSALSVSLVWLASRLWLGRELRRQQLLGQRRVGVLHVALRRRVGLQAHDDGLGGQCFPQPIETRSLVWLCCGVPVRLRTEIIGLPCGSEARFNEICAQEFDRHFGPDFSCGQRAVAQPSMALSAT